MVKMMAQCMMKKNKGVMGVEQQGQFMGVMTRSKNRALQRQKKDGGEFLKLGSRKVDKLGVCSGEVKKKQKKGGSGSGSGNLSKGKGKVKGKGKEKKGNGRKVKEVQAKCDEDKVEVGKGGEGLDDKGKWGEEEMVEDDLGGVGFGAIGGGSNAEVAAKGDGVGFDDSVIDIGDDGMMIGGDGGGDTEYGGVVAAEKGDIDGTAANADGDCIIAGGDDTAAAKDGVFGTSSGGFAAAAEGGVDGTAPISGTDGGQGVNPGDNVVETEGNDGVIRESTPEHLIMRSDYITTPCSSMKGAEFVADERPQTEVGGNSHPHMKLTTDLLLQENSNYAPSMEKYNFDFENEKPLLGRYEWEKVQP